MSDMGQRTPSGTASTLLTLSEAAQHARCSTRTIHRALRRGTLVGFRPQPHAPWLIDLVDLGRYLRGSHGSQPQVLIPLNPPQAATPVAPWSAAARLLVGLPATP